MKEVILLKYGELILKGANKHRFEQLLLNNIRDALRGMGQVSVESLQSTVYVDFADEAADLDEAMKRLSKVFGISALAKAAVCPYDLEQTCRLASEYLRPRLAAARTFRVVGKRADKSYPIKSPQIGAIMGAELLRAFGHLRVSMDSPDVTVYAEVREGHIYVHPDAIKGAGGLPCGCGGHGLLMLSGGIDSPVAGYMMAKRGMRISAIHFESPPYTNERARLKAEKLAKLLSAYCGKISMYIVRFTDVQTQIRDKCRQELFTVIMRRMMLKIACRTAEKCGAKAIITGESLGQVASQTLEAIVCTDAAAYMPVFRPLIGMDKIDITKTAMDIGTYETSIEPYEDCCTVFTPRHPSVKPELESVLQQETLLGGHLLDDIEIERVDIE